MLDRNSFSSSRDTLASSSRRDHRINVEFGRVANIDELQFVQKILLFDICLRILLEWTKEAVVGASNISGSFADDLLSMYVSSVRWG